MPLKVWLEIRFSRLEREDTPDRNERGLRHKRRGAQKRRAPGGPRPCKPSRPGYLPDDPAGQETTGYEQSARAERDQRRATRVGKHSNLSSRALGVLVLGDRVLVLNLGHIEERDS